MHRTTTPGRFNPLASSALAAAIVLAVAWLGATADHAGSAFPGKNGRIAFSSNRTTPTNPEGDAEIFTMNPNGSNVKQLTFNWVRARIVGVR